MTPPQSGSSEGPAGRRPGPGGPGGSGSGSGGSRPRNRRRRTGGKGGGPRPPAPGPRRSSAPRPEPSDPAILPTSSVSATGPGASASVSEREIHGNRRRAGLLCLSGGLGPGLVLGLVLGLSVGPIAGVVVAVAAWVAVALVLWRSGASLALRLIGGRQLDEDEEPRLANLVEGLCATFGVPRPALRLVDDPVPNACTLGRTPREAVVVVTSGLLDRLGLIEMEGVVAHELAHIKLADTVVAGVAVPLLAPWIALGGSDRLFHRVVGTGREYRADQVAALTVRYPPGLHDALASLEGGPRPEPGSFFGGRRFALTRWLWIDPTVGSHGGPVRGDLDQTAARLAALAEW